jgi:hypothetical protein
MLGFSLFCKKLKIFPNTAISTLIDELPEQGCYLFFVQNQTHLT